MRTVTTTMAYLPEPIELDELGLPMPAGDPVVRMPRSMHVPVSDLKRMRGAAASVHTTSTGSLPLIGRRNLVPLVVRMILAGTVLGALGLVVWVVARGRKLPRPVAVMAAVEGPLVVPLTVESAPAVAPRFAETSHRLGRGGALPSALRAVGLDNSHIVCVINALRPLVNMRGLQPGDTVIAQREPTDQTLVSVEYRRSETHVWSVRFTETQQCVGQRIDVVRTIEQVNAGFKVDGPLDKILAKAGLQTEVVGPMQEAFAALDLGRELHRGDVVRLVVEMEKLNGSFFRYNRVMAVDYRGVLGERRGFWIPLGRAGGDWFDDKGFTRARGPLQAPVPSPRITSPFDPQRMHPVLHRVMPHQGVDFGAAMGTPVFAAADGVIIHVGNAGPTGNLVRISHPALGVETGYAHLSRFAPGIVPGMKIHAHTLVGFVGSTGRSTGPHLHFSLKKDAKFIDPMTLYGARRTIPTARRADFDLRVATMSIQLDAIPVEGQPLAAPVVPTPELAPGTSSTPWPVAPVADGGVGPLDGPEIPSGEVLQ